MEVGRAVRQLQAGSEDDRRERLYLWSGEMLRFNEEEQQTAKAIKFKPRNEEKRKKGEDGKHNSYSGLIQPLQYFLLIPISHH